MDPTAEIRKQLFIQQLEREFKERGRIDGDTKHYGTVEGAESAVSSFLAKNPSLRRHKKARNLQRTDRHYRFEIVVRDGLWALPQRR